MEIQTYRNFISTRIIFGLGFVALALAVILVLIYDPKMIQNTLLIFVCMTLYFWQSLITVHISEKGIEIQKVIPSFKQTLEWQEVKAIKNHVFFDYLELVSDSPLSVRLPKNLENMNELVGEIVKRSPNALVDKATTDFLSGKSRK
ncbi:MAG: hypothetical protein ACM3UZ_06295 [Acidobacteriota bacterium]